MRHAPTLPASRGWRLWLVAFGLWLALAAVAALALWHLRRESLQAGAHELRLLSLALTDEIDRGLRGAEEGLRALRVEWSAGHLDPSEAEAQAVLRNRADLMPLVQSLWIVDARGRTLLASGTAPPPDAALFLPHLRDMPPDGVALGGRFEEEGQPSIALAFPLSGAGGWILAAMPAQVLLGAFTAAAPATDARMAVLRADGAWLAGTREAPAHWLAANMENGGVETMVQDGPGTEPALAVLREVPRYAVRVLISRDLSTVLRSWRQTAQGAAVALALLLAIMAAAVHRVQAAERRRAQAQAALQAQAQRSSRLEALGTLAGGVAHDFNNVLAGIVGYGEMAADAAPPDSDQARHLDRVMQAALRGKALVERILAFSRGGARASRVFALEPVVEEALSLLAASLRPGTVIARALEAGGARLRGDPTQAFEAVMNLCTNALQAMPDGGMLGVALRRAHVAQPRVLSHSTLAPGEHLALTVSDQGAGITPEVMEHLFEPFFTTRAASSGTGLGLAMVHGIVAEFGGAIDVQSVPGDGASFTLYLPECVDAPSAAPAPEGEGDVAAPAGAGRAVLVVDDEPALAEMAAELLRGLGYAPVCCHGGQAAAAALAALGAAPQRFAGIVTDEVMPGMTGTQLARAARAIRPELPVLLVSGYGGPLLAGRAAEAGIAQVLGKPLRRAELARALGTLIG